jgi:beta-lactamase regulating signal transducer with metallopeptidase domain
MEQLLVGYFLNSLWQLLLLAVGAWLLVRALRPSPQTQHRLWIALLPLALALPLLSLHSGTKPQVAQAPALPETPSTTELPVAAHNLVIPFPAKESRVPHSSRPHRDEWAPQQFDPPEIRTHTPAPIPISAAPSTHFLRWPATRELRLGPSATRWIAGFYLATIAFALLRLLFALWAAHRVLARSKPAVLNPAQLRLLDQCCGRLGVPRPRVLESAAAHSPMVVGFARPALLLPQRYASHPPDSAHELEAVWLHELAHLRRGDSLANLICRLLALPVAYHPATWAVEQRIRQTREMLCDAMAAAEMQSPTGYARCLVALARTMQISARMTAQFDGAAMFDGTSLEERVMQLIETRNTASLRTRSLRLACAASVILGVVAAEATFYVTPTLAYASTPQSPAPAAANATDPSNQQLDEAREQFETGLQIAANAVSRAAYQGLHAGNLGAGRQFEYSQLQSGEDRKEWNNALKESIDASVLASIAAQMRANELRINNAELKKQIATAEAQANNPEIEKQIAEAEARINSPEFKKQIEDAKAKFNRPEFKEQMKKFNSPEFKKQMDDAKAKFTSPEFKKQMTYVNSDEFKKQMANINAQFNSPEFKKQMEQINNPEFRKQMEDMSRNIREQMEKLQAEMNQLHQQLEEHATPEPAPAPAPTPSVP